MIMLAVKGAGSAHPCAKCKAILGRLPPSNFGDEYFQHYISADPSLWDQYTIEEFAAACAEVKTAWTESRARGEEVETSLGISRDACLTSPLYRVPVSVYWDPMHCLWASGGLGQYEINQWLREVRRHGVPWATLQGFVLQVKVPGPTRCNVQLEQRYVGGPTFHLRGFAAEMLVIVPWLIAFGDMVLAPGGLMFAHMACLRLLYDIQVIIMLGDAAHRIVGLLVQIVAAHHDLYLALYPRCMKPKLHFLRHLPGLIDYFKCVLTCFSGERHHKASKRMASFLYKNMATTLLRRSSVACLHDLVDESLFQEVTLGARAKRQRSRWMPLIRSLGFTPRVRSLSTERAAGACWQLRLVQARHRC